MGVLGYILDSVGPTPVEDTLPFAGDSSVFAGRPGGGFAWIANPAQSTVTILDNDDTWVGVAGGPRAVRRQPGSCLILRTGRTGGRTVRW